MRNTEDKIIDISLILFVLTIIILKCTGVITIPWLWLTSVIWIPFMFGLLFSICMVIFAIISKLYDNIKEKKDGRN